MRGKVALTAVAMMGSVVAGADDVGAQAVIGGEWRDDVERFVERTWKADLIPGVAVAIAVGDRVAWARGFGTADLETGRPVLDGTLFYIASSTKALTATAAVLAAEAGDLDLEAPMVHYLPAAQVPEGVERESITVRDLLTLTHGLAGSGPIVTRTAFTGEFTREELLELLRFHEATGEHGNFDYNNLGYNLLGMVLEAVYDASWKEVVERLVLDPLGMGSTTAWRSSLDPDRLALPHDFLPDGFQRVTMEKDDSNLHAAGGHFASAGDLARFLAAHQSGGLLEGERVFPETPIRQSHRIQVEQDREFGPFQRIGWGHGWDIGIYDGDTLVHRFGSFTGFRSHMSFMPEHELGVAVLVNGEGIASPVADMIATYVYDRLLGKSEIESRYAERLEALVSVSVRARDSIEDHLRERAARLAPLPHALENYAGTYYSPILGTMEWQVVAGGLELHMGVVRSRAELFDATSNRLRVEVGGGGRVVEFSFGGEGRPAESLTLLGVTFERVGEGR